MMPAAFHPDFSLAALTTQINAFSGLWGALTKIDNDGKDTIAVYDDTANGFAVTLRPGPPASNGPGKMVATGTVFVLNQLQQVTAYAST